LTKIVVKLLTKRGSLHDIKNLFLFDTSKNSKIKPLSICPCHNPFKSFLTDISIKIFTIVLVWKFDIDSMYIPNRTTTALP